MANRCDVPVVEKHGGVLVVRDDRYPGGTKARFLKLMYQGCEELVYASPAQGGAQTALATAAAALGKRATIFVAKRSVPHLRTAMAKRLGAAIYQVSPGYLTVVQARARRYCADTGARLVPFGVDTPEAIDVIAAAARATGLEPPEVWCAAGSGVLARGLARAWPAARLHAVAVGRKLSSEDVAGARLYIYSRPFDQHARVQPPFPSDPHYDAKAWEVCLQHCCTDGALFWNVAGPAAP